MRFIFPLVVLPFLFFSCKEKEVCSIPEDKFILVLTDIQIAEAAAQNLMGERKDSVLDAYYEQIYRIHDIDGAEFVSCFKAMQADPEAMGLLYERVLEELSRQQVQVPEEEKGD